MNSQPKVFLSHSGLDHELANSLSQQIEDALNVKVFNTSEPAYRFKELTDVFRPGVSLKDEYERYKTELENYIRKNLLSSRAYILLVTLLSLEADSSWVEFEMNLAAGKAEAKGAFFFPCVAGGARLFMLPKVPMEFQGVELEAEDGFRKLVDCISRALAEG